jgi:hypothetical protein
MQYSTVTFYVATPIPNIESYNIRYFVDSTVVSTLVHLEHVHEPLSMMPRMHTMPNQVNTLPPADVCLELRSSVIQCSV